jgi:hypothetical protein
LAHYFFDVFRGQTSGGRQPGTGSRHLFRDPCSSQKTNEKLGVKFMTGRRVGA